MSPHSHRTSMVNSTVVNKLIKLFCFNLHSTLFDESSSIEVHTFDQHPSYTFDQHSWIIDTSASDHKACSLNYFYCIRTSKRCICTDAK